MGSALLVFVGGGTGAVLRWWLSALLPAPWGTWGVNVLGSLLLAVLLHDTMALPPSYRLLLGTGLMGGFTTYSTFNHDVLSALQRGEAGQALLLATATVLSCLAGAAAGWAVAERLAA